MRRSHRLLGKPAKIYYSLSIPRVRSIYAREHETLLVRILLYLTRELRLWFLLRTIVVPQSSADLCLALVVKGKSLQLNFIHGWSMGFIINIFRIDKFIFIIILWNFILCLRKYFRTQNANEFLSSAKIIIQLGLWKLMSNAKSKVNGLD